MTDWYQTSSQAIRTQPELAQTFAAIVNERILLPTMVGIWGLPVHSCHPRQRHDGFINSIKGAFYLMYKMCCIVVKGSSVITKCHHPDHINHSEC
jgi:hypothetical protein